VALFGNTSRLVDEALEASLSIPDFHLQLLACVRQRLQTVATALPAAQRYKSESDEASGKESGSVRTRSGTQKKEETHKLLVAVWTADPNIIAAAIQQQQQHSKNTPIQQQQQQQQL
jgi:hypothetical protein